MTKVLKVNESKKVSTTTKKVPTKKKTLNLENLTDAELLNINLDDININDLLGKSKALKPKLNTSKNGTKDGLYKNLETDKIKRKNQRTKLRKQRNSFIENILILQQQDNKKELIKEIKLFNIFYKETYFKNDFSINSISRMNADKNTLSKIKIMFHIIKQNKLNK